MEINEKTALELVKNRPQELCKMCGDCCRVVTTKHSYEKLLELKKSGDKGATDFLNIFKPFETIEDARKESNEIVENILIRSKLNEQDITFYKCKNLQENNLCGDYENRPLLCRLNPFSPWSIVPPNCGFNNWLKKQQEKKITEINHQKEVLKELETLLKETSNEEYQQEIQKRIDKINEIIEFYSKYNEF